MSFLWWQRLRRWWWEFQLFRAVMRLREPVVDPADWTEKDIEAVAQWWESTTGRKVRDGLVTIQHLQLRAAVCGRDKTEFDRGVASGWHACFAYLIGLGHKPADVADHLTEFGLPGDGAGSEPDWSP